MVTVLVNAAAASVLPVLTLLTTRSRPVWLLIRYAAGGPPLTWMLPSGVGADDLAVGRARCRRSTTR